MKMSEKIIIPKWLSLLPALAFLWLVIGSLLTFQLWPDLPHTKLQWFLLIAFGPPIYILGEAFFGWLFSPKHGQAISHREFSLVRVLLALPILLALFALSWWVSWLLTQ
jgi:hypothetical protein